MTRCWRPIASIAGLVGSATLLELARGVASHERFGRFGALLALELVAVLSLTALALSAESRSGWRLLGFSSTLTILLLLPPLLQNEWVAGHGFALARPALHGWITPAVLALALAAGGIHQARQLAVALFARPYE